MLLDAVLHDLGPMPHLPKVPVDPAHEAVPAVPQLALDREERHGRPLVRGLEPRRAVGVTEGFRPHLARLPAGAAGDGI